MASAVAWNPFQNEPLKVPEDYEWLKELTKSAGGDNQRRRVSQDDLAPFNRLVDGWLLAIALGARHHSEPANYEAPTHRFEYGSRLAGNEHAIDFLHQVALAELLRTVQNPEEAEKAAYVVIDEPARVIAICNHLAARGMPELRELVDSAAQFPLYGLLRGLAKELEPTSPGDPSE